MKPRVMNYRNCPTPALLSDMGGAQHTHTHASPSPPPQCLAAAGGSHRKPTWLQRMAAAGISSLSWIKSYWYLLTCHLFK